MSQEPVLRLPHPSSQLFPPLALRVKRPLASCPWGWVLAESLSSKLHLSVGRKLAGLVGDMGNAHPGVEAPFEIHERGRLASAIKCSSGAHFPLQPIGRSWSHGPHSGPFQAREPGSAGFPVLEGERLGAPWGRQAFFRTAGATLVTYRASLNPRRGHPSGTPLSRPGQRCFFPAFEVFFLFLMLLRGGM